MTDFELIQKTLKEYTEQASTTLQSKGSDYANNQNGFANFEKIANMMGCSTEAVFLFYISSKVARLAELLLNNKEPKNESIDDTILDCANYLILLKSYLAKNQSVKFEQNRLDDIVTDSVI